MIDRQRLWDKEMNEQNEIVLYQTEDGKVILDVQMHDESMWLSQEQMAELFQRDKSVITRHINNIYAEGELEPKSTSAKNAFVVQNPHIYSLFLRYNLVTKSLQFGLRYKMV